jgi:hypothetical protein
MSDGGRRVIWFAMAAALLVAPLARDAVAQERALSDAQLDKIKGWIGQYGRDAELNKIATEILGLTKDAETISARSLVVRDANNTDDIHQISTIPNGKGFVEEHFHDDKADVYWADGNLALISALNGVRGGRPAEMSFPQAQASFRDELAWWAKFADAH